MFKHFVPTQDQLNILFRDEHFIAIHKPPGLLVHRSPIDKYETCFALQMLRDQIQQHVYPLHRLDKPTSGILLFALSSEAALTLSEQFRKQVVTKHYRALVRGYAPQALLIEHAVKAIKNSKHEKQKVKDAQTQLHCLHQYELPFAVDKYPQSRYSLVELQPRTGRRHQLRYHMKHISHPIIGDAKYGKSKHNHFFKVHFGIERLLLCATKLSFIHPFTQRTISIETQLDKDFLNITNQLTRYKTSFATTA